MINVRVCTSTASSSNSRHKSNRCNRVLHFRRVITRSNGIAGAGPPEPQPGDQASSSSNSSYPALPWEDPQPAPPSANYAEIKRNIMVMDNNQLQTALGVAIAAEDYHLATRIKERLQQKLLESGSSIVSQPMDWRALGVPDWLADRVERLGFMFPTEVQRRSAPVLLSGADAVIVSETGSGKTAACLVPALARLDYPPDLFPNDLEGPQLLLLVPSFELGVQACLLLYKVWGGNISSRTPGDPGNMFTYTGPLGIKVRGLLNDEEIQLAIAGGYLRGVHALVATPDMALALASLPDSPLSFQDLRVVLVDEVDALLQAYPTSFGQIMDAAVNRLTPHGGGGDGGASDGVGQGSSSSSGDGGDGEEDLLSPEERLSKLRSVLDKQQQQQQQQQQSGSYASSSVAAAAARLEGLLAAPSAAPAAAEEKPAEQGAASSAGASSSQPADEQKSSADAPQDRSAAAGSDAAPGSAADLAATDETPMPKPQVVLLGATVSDEDIQLALQRGWLVDPVIVRVGEPGSVPAGLRHRALVVSSPDRRLASLVSSLRRDLTALESADAAGKAGPAEGAAAGTSGGAGDAGGPVRVMVFAPSEAAAVAAAEPLRSALWGDHLLSVLLPLRGAEPLKALAAFRDRVASLLLCTPSAARGLDLPAVSHVYSLNLPQDAKEYVHRAGRAGRIGSTAGGEVCTVVTREELPQLQGMTEELGLHLEVVECDRQGLGLLGDDWTTARQELLATEDQEETDAQQQEQQEQQEQQLQDSGDRLETARKGLEDLFNLF